MREADRPGPDMQHASRKNRDDIEVGPGKENLCCSLLLDGTISDTNRAFCELVGADREALVGRSFFDHCGCSNLGRILENLTAQYRPDGLPCHESFICGFEASGRRLIDWTASLRGGENGTAKELILTGRDITESRAYQVALQQLIAIGNNDNLTLDQRIPEILGIAHRYFGMRFGVVNRAVGGHIEVTHLADPSRGLYEGMRFAPEDTYCAIVMDKGTTMAIPDLSQTELCRSPPYGRIPLGSLLATPIHVGNRIHGALIFGDDHVRSGPFTPEQVNLLSLAAQWLGYELAAQQRNAEQAAREQRYRNLYRRTPVMMHSTDWNGRLVEVSDTWLESLGYCREEVIGRPVLEFMTEESALKAVSERMSGDAGGSRTRGELYVFRRRDGSTIDAELSSIGEWDGLSFANVAENDPPCADQEKWNLTGFGSEVSLCVLVDVTERNHAQRSSAQANARLLRANEGLKRFNLMASHDLQEPLRKIRTFGSMLEKESVAGLSEDAVYALQAMINSSRRLSTLIEDLLSYTRQSDEGFEIETVDMTSLVRGTANTIACDQDADPAAFEISQLPEINCGRVPVERLFTNLLSNAVKYRAPERILEVKVFCRADSVRNTLEIVVRDNGIGIPANQRERVFEPFRRLCTRNEIAGSGIGLAICRMVAAKHGWKLTVQPAPGYGTDFRLAIPASDAVSGLNAIAQADGGRGVGNAA